MKILFITDNFPPERNAPAKRTYDHCSEWVKNGNEVTIITGAPNFPKGKVFKGYQNKLYHFEQMNGLNIKRVWTFITSNSGFFLRIIDYLSFMFSSFICGLFSKKVDIIIATSPQFFTLISGYLLSIFKRTPLAIEIRDLWPESIVAVGAMKESSWVIKILDKLAFFLYRKSSIIITVTHSFKKELIQKGIQEDKIFVIENGFDFEKQLTPTQSIQNVESKHNLNRNKFYVAFTGTVGMAHGLEIIINAAQEINNTNIEFLIIGEGARKQFLKDMVKSKGLNNITFIDNISWIEIVNLNQIINVHLVHLIKDKEFLKVIPSKIFESMALNKPIIMGVDGESRQITNKANCAVNIDPENYKELIEKCYLLYDNPDKIEELGTAGNKYAKNHYSRKILSNKMIEYIITKI